MIAAIFEFILNRPLLLRELGSLLWRCGCLGLLAGAMARSMTAILDVVTSIGAPGQHVDFQTLFPSIPMWWVPESAFGLIAYIALMFAGYTLRALATQIQRLAHGT